MNTRKDLLKNCSLEKNSKALLSLNIVIAEILFDLTSKALFRSNIMIRVTCRHGESPESYGMADRCPVLVTWLNFNHTITNSSNMPEILPCLISLQNYKIYCTEQLH